jgi:AAA family ATP:ADP antiporter
VEKAARAFDVRHGERRMVLVAFMVLLSTITAHTMLETARDALLLAKLPRSSLGVVYIIIAILTIPTGAISAKLGNRFGARRSLTASLVVASFSVLGVHTLPATPKTAIVLYVLTGLIGAVLVPQFWAFTGDLFTVAQGRRLLGPIASAGVIGGLVGSGLAALAVQIFPTRHLLLLASAIFFVAGVALSCWDRVA